jgi:hypothetical protein
VDISLSKLIDKNIKLTSAYSKKLGYAFVDFVGLDMTAALSIFFKWQKMWNKGGGHNFNFISEWWALPPQAPLSYGPVPSPPNFSLPPTPMINVMLIVFVDYCITRIEPF